MIVRRATIEDVEELVDLRIEFLADSSEPSADEALDRPTIAEYLRRTIPSEEYVSWVAVEDGAIVATVGLVTYERMMHSGGGGVGFEGYVLNVFTKPAVRRQGHASRLMGAMLEHAQARCVRLTLVATEEGRFLYEKLGFRHDNRNYRWWPS